MSAREPRGFPRSRIGARALSVTGLLALAACAPIPPPTTGAPPPAARAADTTSRAVRPPAPAVVDSGPTAQAIEVLQSIPEPLAPGEVVPPPATRIDPIAAPDTSAAPDAPADTSDAVPPVPEPTWALGQEPPRPPADSTGVDSSAASQPAAPASPPPSASPAPPPSAPPASPSRPAAPDTCWSVQIAAPAEAAKAEALRDAAASQLLLPMGIEREAGLHKVRTRDCWDAATADQVRKRAQASGFEGAFRFQRKRK